MAESESEIDLLFEQLSVAAGNQQHKKVIKLANSILAIDSTDEDALKCKVIAFMQMSEFQPALEIIESQLRGKLPYEKAYCLYRLGQIREALAAVQLCDSEHEVGRLQLEAQLHYRLSHHKECIQLYDKLFQQHKADSLELKTNVVAAYVSASLASEIPDLMSAMKVNSRQSFELGFNRACGLVEVGDFAAAESELLLALKKGRETLYEEECTEKEIEEELAPLSVQLAYVLARQGRKADATAVMDKVMKLERADEASRTVAMSNVAVDSGRADSQLQNRKFVSNAVKRLEAMLDKSGAQVSTNLSFSPSLESRLSPTQKLVLHTNRALLYFLAGRQKEAAELAGALRAAHPDATTPVLISASLLVKENKASAADKLLADFVNLHPSASAEASIMRAQIAVDTGATTSALAFLESSGLKAVGAVVSSRVALYEQLKDYPGAEAACEEALEYWSSQGPSNAGVEWCCMQLVGMKLRLGKHEEATAIYQQMTQGAAPETSSQAACLARVLRANALSDPQAALAASSRLPSIAGHTKGLDLDELEAQASGRGPGGRFSGGGASRDALKKRGQEAMDVDVGAEGGQQKKKRRKRKIIYPKGYDPSLPNGGLPPPDPERWLPKWQRADFKKKMKRRRDRDTVKGSQGAGKVDDALDRTKGEAQPAKIDPSKAGPSRPNLPNRGKSGKGKK